MERAKFQASQLKCFYGRPAKNFKGKVKLMARNPKKTLRDSGGISAGEGQDFSVSIGNLLGREQPPREDLSNPNTDSPVAKATPGDTFKSAERVILRRESAGRGGRTVTVAEPRPPFDAKSAEDAAKSMRKALGCGAHVEGTKVILHGDMRERAESWLAKQGVKKIVMGN